MRKHAGRLFIQLCLSPLGSSLNNDALHLFSNVSAACLSENFLPFDYTKWMAVSKHHTLYFRLVDDGFVAIYYLKCCCDFHISPKLKRGSLLIPAVQFKKLYKSENMQFMHLFCEHTNAKGWSWPCAWPQVKLSPTSHLTPELSTDLLGSKVC